MYWCMPGPNGPLPKEVLEMYPDAPLVKRQGEVDAWDNTDFQAAVRAANKSQIIMAGIVTDVCEFCPLSIEFGSEEFLPTLAI